MSVDNPITDPVKIQSLSIPSGITFYRGKSLPYVIGTDSGSHTYNLYPNFTLGLKITPRVFTKSGTQSVEVIYRQGDLDDAVSLTTNVTVVNPTPVSARLVAGPINKKFYVNYPFDRAGITLEITYDSGDVKIVGAGSIVATPDVLTTPGSVTMTYSYTENGATVTTTTDTVEVVNDPVSGLLVYKYPELIFAYGETPTVEATVIRQSGARETISNATVTPSTIEETTTEITVTYDGFSVTVPIIAVRPLLGTTYVVPGEDGGETTFPFYDAGNGIVYDSGYSEMFPYTVS